MVCLQIWFVVLMLMVILSDVQTRAAIHAPTSKDWVEYSYPVFAPTDGYSKQTFSRVYIPLT